MSVYEEIKLPDDATPQYVSELRDLLSCLYDTVKKQQESEAYQIVVLE